MAVIGFHASRGLNEANTMRDEGSRFPCLTNPLFSPINRREKEIIPPLIIRDPIGEEGFEAKMKRGLAEHQRKGSLKTGI